MEKPCRTTKIKCIWTTTKKNQWGLPSVTFDATIRENELEMRKDMKEQAIEMLEKAGFKNVSGYDNNYALGLGIHEMGTARMGSDPKTSVLGAYNGVHSVPNVYVTDGAAMTSASNVNRFFNLYGTNGKSCQSRSGAIEK